MPRIQWDTISIALPVAGWHSPRSGNDVTCACFKRGVPGTYGPCLSDDITWHSSSVALWLSSTGPVSYIQPAEFPCLASVIRHTTRKAVWPPSQPYTMRAGCRLCATAQIIMCPERTMFTISYGQFILTECSSLPEHISDSQTGQGQYGPLYHIGTTPKVSQWHPEKHCTS